MQTPPPLFDRSALALRRARAARAPELFLQTQMAAEVQERLTEVNRTFTAPAVVTPWPDLWRDILPDAAVVADAETLDLTPGALDLVIHGLNLHWANDPVGQLVQCRHALRPDGLLIATLFGGDTLQELRRCLAQAETNLTGGLSPRVAPMGDLRDLGGLLRRAGLAQPVADNAQITVTYASALHLMHDLRAMGETNVMAGRLRGATRRAVLFEAMRLYHDTFATPDGRIPATFDIVTLTGWAPAPDQQQPLRPGSAQQRLAEALGTDEAALKRSND